MLPATVTATLDDNSTAQIQVDWAVSIPGFDGTAAGSQYTVEGNLVNLPEGVWNTANAREFPPGLRPSRNSLKGSDPPVKITN